MVMEQVQGSKAYKLPLNEIQRLAPDIAWSTPPTINPDLSPVEVCHLIGEWYTSNSNEAHRHTNGQFFTPPPVARYMANIAGTLHTGMHILDPGAGTGILASAICEMAILQHITAFSIEAYESDPVLHKICSFTLNYVRDRLQERGIALTFEVHQKDFIEAMGEQITQTSLWSNGQQPQHPFDLAILNPPYFKVNQKDIRTQRLKDIVQGRTNMYTMFMSLAASSLRAGGRLVSITPRSFSSGAYFKYFRQQFFTTVIPELIHIFDSRRSTFEDASVLQENIILAGTRRSIVSTPSPTIAISQSQGLHDLAYPLVQQKPRRLILDDRQKDPILHLPTSDIDTHLLQVFKQWDNHLATYGLEISTGPVVPFRTPTLLTSAQHVYEGEAVPLLWLQHVRWMNIQWPIEQLNKPQGILLQADAKLLVKNATQVILRRFSAKEEPRRITAAVLFANTFNTNYIGLENHLNYLYRPKGTLSNEEATGIAAFLNSTLVDRYFRIANGNTQVSATELRQLPLPSWEQIIRIGKGVMALLTNEAEKIEHIVMDELGQDLIVGNQEEDLQLLKTLISPDLKRRENW